MTLNEILCFIHYTTKEIRYSVSPVQAMKMFVKLQPSDAKQILNSSPLYRAGLKL